MKFKLTLATATAIGLLTTGAMAGSGNTLYLEQNGDENSADVFQSNGGGGNDIGTPADPVTQQGDHNTFKYSNQLSGSGTNNDVTKAKQEGDSNYMSFSVWNGALNNTYSKTIQDGDSNQARISANGSDNGLIQDVLQQGDKNHLVIEQSSSHSTGNQVLLVSQIGSNNGLAPDANGAAKRAGAYIFQSGNNNIVVQSKIEGSGNIGPSGDSNTHRSTHRIEQRGDSNSASAETLGSKIGSDYNRIWILQTGNFNDSSVTQGVNSSSFGNRVTATQNGNHNTTTASQYGNENLLNAQQIGDANTITAHVNGNSNGSGIFSDSGASGLASSYGLVSGDIFQSGNLHTVSLDITSSNNQFAFSQLGGDSNIITATISGTGNNQAVGVQSGSNNTASLTQAGGNSVAVFQQVGGSNSTSISQ